MQVAISNYKIGNTNYLVRSTTKKGVTNDFNSAITRLINNEIEKIYSIKIDYDKIR